MHLIAHSGVVPRHVCNLQVFVFVTISKFGALNCALIGLGRKILSLMLSFILYGHTMNAFQTVGLALSLAAMIANFYEKVSEAALYCVVLHCTALYCTALRCTALHCTALYCTALHCVVLHCTALRCTALFYTAG
jgi:hypothetical protein